MASYVDERGNRVTEADSQKKVELTPVEARQGLLGRPVLMVLIGGLLLAAVAWVVAEGYGESTDTDLSTPTQAPAATQADPTSSQPTIDNTPSSGERMQPAPADTDPTAQSGTGVDVPPATPPAPAN